MCTRRISMVISALLVATAARADEPSPSPSPAPEKPQHALVTGQAFDHMGAGVENAEITLNLADGTLLGPVKSDRIGDFKISADTAHAGKAVVTVRKEHFKDIVVEVTLGGPEGAPFVDASMRGALALTGTVTSRQGEQPIAGAEVTIDVGYDERHANTDTNGAFHVEELPPGHANITVKAEGFARERRELDAVEAAGPQAFVLAPERIAHLHITDEAEKPIAGVGVECVDEAVRDYRHLITDEAGKVIVRGLRFDAPELLVRLSHEHYVSSTDFDRTVTLPEDTNVSTHGLVMQSAGVIAGTVTDAAGGEPLYGARLTAGRVVSDRLPRAWTDFEGNYRLIGVTPGRTPVTVHFADHAPQIAEVQVVAGEEVKLDFALAAGRVIIGQVVDAEGQPVPRVHIMATRWAGHETLGLQAMTDGAGRFIIADAPRDEFEICLYAPGYKPLLDQIVSPQQKEYAFALKPDARKAPGIEGTGPAVGSEAPTFTLTTLDGKPLDLAGLKGKVVLLDFWATWCAPCVTEIPNLAAVQQAFGTRGDFVMLSISIEEDAARVRSFTEGRKMSWPQATAADRGAADAVERYEVNAIPALYIIDREGRIAARDVRGTAIVDTVRNVLGNE